LDLFSGAGGTAIGLHRAGFDVTHFEWDADACATLRAAFPGDEVHEGDLRQSPWESWAGRVHLLWSSFPCQAWSTSGKRVGARDERNGWPWTVEAIDRSRPTWVLCENVEGLMMHRGGVGKCGGDPDMCPGCYFDGIILPQLRERFAHVSWRLIDAADYGVPQRRLRIILAAGPQPFPWPTPTHCDPSFLIPIQRGQRLPWVSVRTALKIDVGQGAQPYWLRQEMTNNAAFPIDGVAPTVTTSGVLRWYTGSDPGRRPQVQPDPSKRNFRNKDLRVPDVERMDRGTLELFADGPPEPADDPQAHSVKSRRVTVAECAVFQGFPADHPFQGNLGARYKQVGNAVSPPVAEALGKIVAGLV
jgi:DNA (cytosine-5)-methyltransferase 1